MILVYAAVTCFLMAVLAAIFEHVSQLYMQLDFINEENLKLLNGMHEGVLIISKPSDDNE